MKYFWKREMIGRYKFRNWRVTWKCDYETQKKLRV